MKIFEIDKLIASVQGYVETKMELVKLDAKEEFQSVAAKFFVLSLMVITGLMTLLFLSIALSFFLNSLLESNSWGFLIVGALYLIITILVFSNKERILEKVGESIKEHD